MKKTKTQAPPKKLTLSEYEIALLLEVRDMGGFLHQMCLTGPGWEFSKIVPYVAMTLGEQIHDMVDEIMEA